MTRTVWVSALIPSDGADGYGGVRISAASTELACYRDLAYWLVECSVYYGDDDEPLHWEMATKRQIVEVLNDAVDERVIDHWKVEDIEVSGLLSRS